MRVFCPSTLTELEPYAEQWDQLAGGVPFRGWTWLSSWWRHYGPRNRSEDRRKRLAAICVFDDAGALVGVAPWYLDSSPLHGRVLRFLGSGKVCSDHLTVLCQPSREDAVLEAMADYLIENVRSRRSDRLSWDLLALDAVDASDRTIAALAAYLGIAGCTIHRRPGPHCWRIELPTDWNTYVNSLESKNLRRDLRRLARNFVETNRAVLRSVRRLEELPDAMNLFVELHQRRRESLGETGCFASPQFLAFYRDVVPELLRRGHLHLCWMEIDGRPVAAEYQLSGNGVLYAYMVGMSPDAVHCQPGKLNNMLVLQDALQNGYRAFDFLRGDERYKARFGATPRPTLELRIVPDRAAARVRHNLWAAGSQLKHWLTNADAGTAMNAEDASQASAALPLRFLM